MNPAARANRITRELTQLSEHPPPGLSCWSVDDNLNHLAAQIVADDSTPYAGGVFRLDIRLPDRYPFEPPNISFVTRIYHPNIDSEGRICLESLKMPPQGGWSPALNVGSVLQTILVLMSEPNPSDPLMVDIAKEFQFDKSRYEQTAREWTKRYAVDDIRGKTMDNSRENLAVGESSLSRAGDYTLGLEKFEQMSSATDAIKQEIDDSGGFSGSKENLLLVKSETEIKQEPTDEGEISEGREKSNENTAIFEPRASRIEGIYSTVDSIKQEVEQNEGSNESNTGLFSSLIEIKSERMDLNNIVKSESNDFSITLGGDLAPQANSQSPTFGSSSETNLSTSGDQTLNGKTTDNGNTGVREKNTQGNVFRNKMRMGKKVKAGVDKEPVYSKQQGVLAEAERNICGIENNGAVANVQQGLKGVGADRLGERKRSVEGPEIRLQTLSKNPRL